MPLLKLLILTLVFTLTACSQTLQSNQSAKILPMVQELIDFNQEPHGVVLELESDDKTFALSRTDLIVAQIKALKDKYPRLDVVLLSHGAELHAFSLQGKHLETYSQLVKEGKVMIHVCEVTAGLIGLNPEDFPDFIDVAPSGTAQLNDYIKLEYDVVRIP